MITRTLITGFPGALSKALAQHRLDTDRDARIWMLVSAEDVADPIRSPWALFTDQLPGHARKRITPLVGDLHGLDLGLSGADAQRLIEQCDFVIHAALTVKGSRDALWRHHVRPLRDLLSLAREMKKLQRLGLMSTAFVSGDRGGIIYEEDLDKGQGFHSPFEWSMCQAERMAREIMPWLPITVLRPSAILGGVNLAADLSARSAADLDLGPRYLLDLMVRLPADIPVLLPGGARVPLNLVPMAYVIQATWALITAPAAAGRTFHLTDPNPLSAKQVFEILSDVTRRPRPVTTPGIPGIMRKALSLPLAPAAIRNPTALLDTLSRVVTYHCAGTLEMLGDQGIPCPPFETYVDDLLAWAAAQGSGAGARP